MGRGGGTGGAAALHAPLFWQSLTVLAIALGLLIAALWLWPRSPVEILDRELSADLSPHLHAGYFSRDGGAPHFVGTLRASWDALARVDRQRVVVRIASVLGAAGISSVTLVDAEQRIQARHDGDSLVWIAAQGQGDG